MMRLVLECNVVISAALTAGTCRWLVGRTVREHIILVCDDILREYRTVAARPKFSRRRGALDAIISTIEAAGVPVHGSSTGFALPDPCA